MAHRGHFGGSRRPSYHPVPLKSPFSFMPSATSATGETALPLPSGDSTPLPRDEVEERSLSRIDREGLAVNGTIEDLLTEQLVAVERVLAFNQVISQRLFGQRERNGFRGGTPSQHEQFSGSYDAASSRRRSRHQANGLSPDLTTPLLSCTNDETWSKSLMQVMPSARSTSVESWSSVNAERLQSSRVQPKDCAQILDAGGPVAESGTAHSSPLIRATSPKGPGGKSQRLMHLFPMVENIKQHMVESMGQRVYNVENLYHKSGYMQALAKSVWFNNLALSVILLNTIWIAIDTDLNHADVLSQAPALFQVVENCFCTFFVFEMVVRVMAFRDKSDALRDGWLMFDVCLVASMVWETWILVLYFRLSGSSETPNGRTSTLFRIFRLFRLTRVARTARLVGNVPELMILAKGMACAVRSVAAVLCLLAIVIYIFSIVFCELLGQTDAGQGSFESVPQAMNTLLLQVVCGFDLGLVNNLLATDYICYIVFLAYFLIASLTIMNMLIGILCDVVSNVAIDGKEETFVLEVENLVGRLMADLDTDGSKTLSREEFDGIIMNQEMVNVLHDFGVDVVGIVDFAEFLFQECDELSFADFLQLVVQFRESKTSTMKDVMDLRKYLARELSSLEARMNGLEAFEATVEGIGAA